MAWRYNAKQQRRPIGGQHFPCKDGNIIKAETFGELVTKVLDYRLNNGHPVGDPEHDIVQYYATNYPFMVEEYESGDEAERHEDSDMVYRWVNSVWTNPPSGLLSKLEAAPLIKTCLDCPHNVDLEDLPQADSFDTAISRALVIRKFMSAPDNLGWCDHHKWLTPLALFIKENKKYSSGEEPYPEGCWVDKNNQPQK